MSASCGGTSDGAARSGPVLVRYRLKPVLFGSLASGRFRPDSDIDLAVEGLAAASFFRALAQASRLSLFPLDLKPLEDLAPHFKARVRQTGEEI